MCHLLPFALSKNPESDMNMHAQIDRMILHTAAHHHIHTFIHFYKAVIAYLICLHICSLLSLLIILNSYKSYISYRFDRITIH